MKRRWAWLGAVVLVLGVLLGAGCSRIYSGADETRPLPAGSTVPAVSLTTVQGESVALSELLRDRGALLVFYRGGW